MYLKLQSMVNPPFQWAMASMANCESLPEGIPSGTFNILLWKKHHIFAGKSSTNGLSMENHMFS